MIARQRVAPNSGRLHADARLIMEQSRESVAVRAQGRGRRVAILTRRVRSFNRARGAVGIFEVAKLMRRSDAPMRNRNISSPERELRSYFQDLFSPFFSFSPPPSPPSPRFHSDSRLLQFIALAQETTTQNRSTHGQFECFHWYSSVERINEMWQ